MDTASTPVRPGAVTLDDVAREAGVSLATASRVLNGSTRRVAEDYRKKVRAAADRLGYTANLSAQATARGTSATIALLVADIADPYFGLIASGVARGADEAGLVVTIGTTEHDHAREIRMLRTLRGQRPRGVILAASRVSVRTDAELQREVELLTEMGGRVVMLGSHTGFATVSIDNHGGARALGAALADRGYRRAVVLAAAEGLVTSDERLSGFAAGFAAGGGGEPRVYRGGISREAGIDLMNAALADGIEPGTVVFGISDVIAIGAMVAVRAAGREVGEDIALAGFDDIPTASDVSPALTSVRIPLGDVGRQAFRAVVDDEWVQDDDALRLEVRLRDSSPARS